MTTNAPPATMRIMCAGTTRYSVSPTKTPMSDDKREPPLKPTNTLAGAFFDEASIIVDSCVLSPARRKTLIRMLTGLCSSSLLESP